MFDTTVAGIPCQAEVNIFYEKQTMDCPASEDICIVLYDRKGYRAKWLENKLNSDAIERLIAEAERAYAEREY